MSVNTSNIPVTVPASSLHVQLPNGNTVAVVVVSQLTPVGNLDELMIAEATAGTSSFFANSADAGAIPDASHDPYQSLADLLIYSGMDPATMGADQVAFAKAWLPQQTYQSAYNALFRGFAKLISQLNTDLAVVYPPVSQAPPAPSTNAPKDFNDFMNWALTNRAKLNVDPVTSAVTASLA